MFCLSLLGRHCIEGTLRHLAVVSAAPRRLLHSAELRHTTPVKRQHTVVLVTHLLYVLSTIYRMTIFQHR